MVVITNYSRVDIDVSSQINNTCISTQ